MIERIIDKRAHDLGGGFVVGRVLPFHARRMVGPYVFFDHMGPVDLPAGIPRDLDVRPHPHIGLSTVTYLYDGALTHRDSLGFHQEILPGEVNWMTAGSGITHSERLEYARSHGATMHGIQAWVALPEEDEECDPGFWHHAGADLPEWHEKGLRGRADRRFGRRHDGGGAGQFPAVLHALGDGCRRGAGIAGRICGAGDLCRARRGAYRRAARGGGADGGA
ncbi:pirin family protein [Novosphingobium colocasiae]